MSSLDDARRLFASGKENEAIALIMNAAAKGDAEAAIVGANWRLFGLYGDRDLDMADRLLRLAESSNSEARRLRLQLIGNGTLQGGHIDVRAEMAKLAQQDEFARIQNELLNRQDAAPARWSSETICRDPDIRIARGLFSPEDCNYLRVISEPKLRPSMIVDPSTGQRRPDPIRTSFSASIAPTEEDLFVHSLNRRIADASGTETGRGEPLHILRYAPGQEYKPHVDAIPGLKNQRSHTVIAYLNEDYEGGETVFPLLDLKLRGRQGDALIFANVDAGGQSDERTRHAGMPVTSGEKWIATRWIRKQPYHVWKTPDHA